LMNLIWLKRAAGSGSARVSRVGCGVSPQQSFVKVRNGEDAIARHARRGRYPD